MPCATIDLHIDTYLYFILDCELLGPAQMCFSCEAVLDSISGIFAHICTIKKSMSDSSPNSHRLANAH